LPVAPFLFYNSPASLSGKYKEKDKYIPASSSGRQNMIIGSHMIIFSTDPEADRLFLRDVLRLPNVDAGDGWLIFEAPPAEIAVHPHQRNSLHKLYLMCDNIQSFMEEMKAHHIASEKVVEAEWGLLTNIRLPGGGKLGVYEPHHARPGYRSSD
jgi:hypothetical protein